MLKDLKVRVEVLEKKFEEKEIKEMDQNVVNKGTQRENHKKCKFYNAGFCKYKF